MNAPTKRRHEQIWWSAALTAGILFLLGFCVQELASSRPRLITLGIDQTGSVDRVFHDHGASHPFRLDGTRTNRSELTTTNEHPR